MKIKENRLPILQELERDFPDLSQIFTEDQMCIFKLLYQNLQYKVPRSKFAPCFVNVTSNINLIRRKIQKYHMPFVIITSNENKTQVAGYELWKFL
jgi:hypothetical protein